MSSIPSIDLQVPADILNPKEGFKMDPSISVLYYLALVTGGNLRLEQKACEESVADQTMQQIIEQALQSVTSIEAKEKLLQFFRKIFAGTQYGTLLKGWINGYYDQLVDYQQKIATLLSKYQEALAKLEKEEDMASGVEDKAADAKAKMQADLEEVAKYEKLAKENALKHPAKAAKYAALAKYYQVKANIQDTAYLADEATIKLLHSKIAKEFALVREAQDKYKAKKDELVAKIKALMVDSNNLSPQELDRLQQDFKDLLTVLKNESDANPFRKVANWFTNQDKELQKKNSIWEFLNRIPIVALIDHFKGYKETDKLIDDLEKKNLKKGDLTSYYVDEGLKWVVDNTSLLKMAASEMKLFAFLKDLPGYRLTKAMNNVAIDGQKFVALMQGADQVAYILSRIDADELQQAIETHNMAVKKYSESSNEVDMISSIIQENTESKINA